MKVENSILAKTNVDDVDRFDISITVMLQLLKNDITKRVHTILHTQFISGKQMYWETISTGDSSEQHQLIQCAVKKDMDVLSIEDISDAVNEFYNHAIKGDAIFKRVIIKDFKNKIEEAGKTFENVSIWIKSKDGRYESELYWIDLIYMACVDISNEYNVSIVSYPITTYPSSPTYAFKITSIPYKTVSFVSNTDITYPEFPNGVTAVFDKPKIEIDNSAIIGCDIAIKHGLDYGVDVVSLHFIKKPILCNRTIKNLDDVND